MLTTRIPVENPALEIRTRGKAAAKPVCAHKNHHHSLRHLTPSRRILLNSQEEKCIVSLRLHIWSLTLREEHRLRVFENRVLRRIFGPKRDEVTGEWRRLHNEEINDLYSSPNIIWAMKLRRM
jgi:hypothetical protein